MCVCVCVENGFIESSLFAGLFDRGFFFFFPVSYQGDSCKSSSAPITNRPPQ